MGWKGELPDKPRCAYSSSRQKPVICAELFSTKYNRFISEILKKIKRFIYRHLPAWGTLFHAKRRKGFQSKWQGEQVLECQAEQDRIFWEKVLEKKTQGSFWELDAGDGATGSHGISLEESHGWKGVLWEERQKPAEYARKARQSSVLGEGSGFFNSLIQKNSLSRPDYSPE